MTHVKNLRLDRATCSSMEAIHWDFDMRRWYTLNMPTTVATSTGNKLYWISFINSNSRKHKPDNSWTSILKISQPWASSNLLEPINTNYLKHCFQLLYTECSFVQNISNSWQTTSTLWVNWMLWPLKLFLKTFFGSPFLSRKIGSQWAKEAMGWFSTKLLWFTSIN